MPIPSRWLSDDAVQMQLAELGSSIAVLSQAPDPARARRWLVSLCLFRFDQGIQAALRADMDAARPTWQGKPIWRFMFDSLLMIGSDPTSVPFCLSEREYAYYCRELFGDQVPNIEGIYHPPNFYLALGQDALNVAIGISVGAAIPLILPEAAGAAALSAPVLATASGRAVIGTIAGSVTSHLLPGGSWDAAKKDRLWPRYEADYYRRLLK